MDLNLQTYFDRGMTYATYRQRIAELLKEKRSTAPPDQDNEYLVRYSRRNQRRMKQLDGNIELLPELASMLENWSEPLRLLVLTEGWCPDAGNILPYVQTISDATYNLETRYVLRETHPELMDEFLTQDSRSIPIVIGFRAIDGTLLFRWGPRPEPAQAMVIAGKAHPERKAEITQRLLDWYQEDAGRTLQREVLEKLRRIEVVLGGSLD